MKPLPTVPQSPMEIVGNGFGLGIGVYPKIFMATSLIAFIELLPTMDLALRLGNAEITPEDQLHQQFSLHQLSVQLTCLLLVLLVQGMAIARLDHIATGQAGDYRDEWRRGLWAFLPLLGAFLLGIVIGIVGCLLAAMVGLLVGMLGSLLLGKAGFGFLFLVTIVATVLYMAVYLMFIQYCIVLEAKGPIDAVNRSFRLVYGRWWRAFAVLLLLAFVIVIVTILLAIVASPTMTVLNTPMTGRRLFIFGVVQMVVSALVAPVLLAVFYTLYRDLKLRSAEA